MHVYFAAPLFCQAELAFNESVVEDLENAGHEVFLPQRDGMETTDIADRSEFTEKADMMQAIFELDRSEVNTADVVTAVLDGRTVDEGVAVEIGLAHAWNIPIIGLRTDRRAFGEDEPVNAMVYGATTEIVETPDALVTAVNDHADSA